MKELLSILKSIGNIPNAELEQFINLSREKKIAKGSYFICEGSPTSKLGFVGKGLFRSLYSTEKGDECTFAFTTESKFIYECQAMRTFEVAQYSIQALENSIILKVDYPTWVDPFKDSAWWNKILLDLTTWELSLKNRREIELMNLNGKERYISFLERYMSLEHRIKQHIIASYLGITSVSLSRIRREMGLIP